MVIVARVIAYDTSLDDSRVVSCRVVSRAYDTMGLLRLAFEAREGGWVVVSQCITPAFEAREGERVTVVMWKTINNPSGSHLKRGRGNGWWCDG